MTTSLPLQLAIVLSALVLPVGDPWKEVVSNHGRDPLIGQRAEAASEPDHPLDQLERLQSAWNSAEWEEALKRYLELPEPLRTASSFWVPLDGIEPGSDVYVTIRDRAWRHLQDRMAVLDLPGQSEDLRKFLPRIDRLLLICRVTGMPLPHRAQEIRQRWQHRVQARMRTDEWLTNLENAFDLQEDWRAGELLALKSQLPWLEESVEARVQELLESTSGALHRLIEEARVAGDTGRVLDGCLRLKQWGLESPEAEAAHGWALQRLRTLAKHNLDMKRSGQALLQMARLAVEEELPPVELGGLRQQLVRPLRPRILTLGERPHEASAERHLLLQGIPQLTETAIAEVDQSPIEREPVGRFWSRSPGHLADAKRWVDLVDTIVHLNRRWLESHPSEAGIIRQRIDFHVTEAQRLGERLESSPARRSRLVWKDQLEQPSQKSVKVTLTCPVHLFIGDGQEVSTSIEISEVLHPSVSEGIQLPVSRFEIEALERRLRARLPARIEALADRWAQTRLEKTLTEAQGLARAGSPRAALELLLPALLGAGDPANALIEKASTDLAEWSGLGRRAVQMALGKSETP